MRRSSRIHLKAQPRLPVEVQLAVARQAGLELYAAGTKDALKQMTQLCLVSQEWTNEIQRIMFRSVRALKSAGRHLSSQLRPRSRAAQHIQEIDFFGSDYYRQETTKILSKLALLPSLKKVSHLCWTDSMAVVEPPAHSARPALDALQLVDTTASTALRLEDFFDRTALDSFGLGDPYGYGELSSPCLALLALVPTGVHALDLKNVHSQDLAALPDALARFVDLTSLTFVMGGGREALLIRLPTSPRLVNLTVSLTSIPRALETGQPALRRLVLFYNYEATIAYPAQSIVRQVREACRIVTTTSAGRFPALRTIAFTRAGHRLVAFSDNDRAHYPRNLPRTDLAGLSQALHAAGLRLVDDEGVEWREEWEQELAAGQV